MSRLERALYRRRALLFITAAVLFLGGAVGVAFLQISQERARGNELATNLTKANTEADKRGTAVSTLAGDVRALRAQVQAGGHTPVAPDPANAIPSLPDRTAVPVPIPGPEGPQGPKGDPGPTTSPIPGPTGSPGAQGAQGVPGANSTVPGPQGAQGVPGTNGKDGKDGKDGTNGQPPAGWTWTWTDQLGTVHTYTCQPVADFDPTAPRYTCPETTAPPPATTPPNPASRRTGLLGIGMLVSSAVYRRIT